MEPASHTDFIVAAYAAAGAVIGGLTAWVMLDYRAQLRKLADLEKLGITRRGVPPGGDRALNQTMQQAPEEA
jgi:heme exporter protein D